MSSKIKKIILTITVAAGVTIACALPDTEVDASGPLLLIALTNQLQNTEAYDFSCNGITALSTCENTFRASTAAFSHDCSTSASVVRTKCTATGAVGVCVFPSSQGGHFERVYYASGFTPYNSGTASSSCTSGGGTFSANYSP
ncbi:MAG: hypothetical protein RIF32_20885 [Leptospirales bacterium]|jgi:hypothetical protein